MSDKHLTLKRRVLAVLQPTIPESILLLFVAVMIFLTSNWDQALNILSSGLTQESDTAFSLSNLAQDYGSVMNGSEVASYISSALFWAAIGSAVYVIIVILVSVLTETSELFAITFHYKHPQTYNPVRYWLSYVGEKLLRACVVIVSVFYGVIFVTIVLPWLMHQFSNVWLENRFDMLLLARSLGLFLAATHLLVIIFRLIFVRLYYDKGYA